MTTTKTNWVPFALVTMLFFVWGFVTSVIDDLAPAARAVFSLTYTEQMLTQFSFFLAYGVVSLPAAFVVARLGGPGSIISALGVMVLGCLTVLLATSVHSYAVILLALFIMASGITLLQVAANPLSAALGDPARASFRLTFSQAFNSLGTVLGPNMASLLLLTGGVFPLTANVEPTAAAKAITLGRMDTTFLIIAAVIVALGALLWTRRRVLHAPLDSHATTGSGSVGEAFRSGWALFGALSIFLYVGSEVSIGTMMVNFLQLPTVLGVSASRAGQMLGLFYWGGAMLGRFIGSEVLRRIEAGRVLGFCAVVNILLCLLVSQIAGPPAAYAALAVGFFNSVMFPTIFTLTFARSAAPAASVSGLLCTAIVGGAVMPLLSGWVADRTSLSTAFFVPLVGYVGILAFALSGVVGTAATLAPAE